MQHRHQKPPRCRATPLFKGTLTLLSGACCCPAGHPDGGVFRRKRACLGLRIVDVEGRVALHQAKDGEIVNGSIDYGDRTGVNEVRRHGLYPLTVLEVTNGTSTDFFEFTYLGGERKRFRILWVSRRSKSHPR